MATRIIDTDTYGFILNNAKLLNSNIDEKILKFYIDKTIQEITIKTNRNNFPSDLKYLVIELLNDALSINNMNESATANQSIKSMSEGDRKVDFGLDSYSQARFNLLLEQKLNDNAKLINRYRLMYKVVGLNGEN